MLDLTAKNFNDGHFIHEALEHLRIGKVLLRRRDSSNTEKCAFPVSMT